MLIFALIFFSQIHDAPMPGPVMAFLGVWFLVLICIIGYHVINAASASGLPTTIVESEDHNPTESISTRLKELEELRSSKLVTDAEYATKRQEILKGL